VAATGTGERIVEAGLARQIHGLLASGLSAREAADQGVALLRGSGDIGIVVVSLGALAAAADRPMAWAGRESGSGVWQGP
jgi:isoaspartyl peptidase/L-asparaginase-like protein (Ntn-hydrolase superfamily)